MKCIARILIVFSAMNLAYYFQNSLLFSLVTLYPSLPLIRTLPWQVKYFLSSLADTWVYIIFSFTHLLLHPEALLDRFLRGAKLSLEWGSLGQRTWVLHWRPPALPCPCWSKSPGCLVALQHPVGVGQRRRTITPTRMSIVHKLYCMSNEV